ncbi:MAG: poly(3-hydroxyalkanoate) depolymerase [Streptosporangiaceae bacterium]
MTAPAGQSADGRANGRPGGRVPFDSRALAPGEHVERHINVSGQQLRVAVRAGLPGRVPLLMINGLATSLELLQPIVDALDPSVPVIRFDVPGIGGSPAPDGPYRVTGLCQTIADLLTVLGYERADVLGVSWGGGVAQQFAVSQTSRCRRLILVSTGTGFTMVPANPIVLTMLMMPPQMLDVGVAERIAPSVYGGTARTDPAAVVAAIRAASRLGSNRGALYQIGASFGWTSLPFLPRLSQPTLIMSGTDDPIIPLANAYMLHALIRRSQLHVFDDGHLGLMTEAAQLVPVIEKFLGVTRQREPADLAEQQPASGQPQSA